MARFFGLYSRGRTFLSNFVVITGRWRDRGAWDDDAEWQD